MSGSAKESTAEAVGQRLKGDIASDHGDTSSVLVSENEENLEEQTSFENKKGVVLESKISSKCKTGSDGNSAEAERNASDDDQDDDATDEEYYENSEKDPERENNMAQKTSSNTSTPEIQFQPKPDEDIICPVCFDEFDVFLDLRQHLSTAGCQPETDAFRFECDHCGGCCEDVQEFKDHHLQHLGGETFSCAACGTEFTTKRDLDEHMLVDASILNRLRSGKEMMSLPDLLCRTVVEVLSESTYLSNSRKQDDSAMPWSENDDDDDDDDDDEGDEEEEETEEEEKEAAVGEKATRKDSEEEPDIEMDEADEEFQGEEGGLEDKEESEDSDLLSDIEQDLEEEEDVEDEISRIPQPFLSSSLTDDPLGCENEDSVSVTSQSLNSVEDLFDNSTNTSVSFNSRRKSKHPKQVQKNAQGMDADKVEVMIIKAEPLDDDTGLTGLFSTIAGSLICPMCGDRLSDKQKLELHIAEHEKLFPYFCSLCDANFMEGRLLRAHVAAYHSANQSLQCQMCGMYFKLRGSLGTHMKYCRQAPACVVCGEHFAGGPDLEKHYYSHSVEERAASQFMSCSECGEVFVSTVQLREHQKKHGTSRPFSCELCNASFTHQKILDKHHEAHVRQEDCKCEICGVQLLTRSGYIAHLKGHKNNESLPAGLDAKLHELLARKVGSKKKKGKKKRVVEEDEENQDLTLDTEKYLKLVEDQLSSLESASLEKSPNCGKSRLHSCPFCDLTFTSADGFQAHVFELHKDQARFVECEVCHRKIYGKEYLVKHRRTHASVTERFSCDQCSKVFRRKWSLETHRKIHTFKKFVRCDICGEEFRFISEVDKHKHRVHKYDRIQSFYECNLCGMKFATLSHLSIHSSHSHKPSEGKPFKCSKCPTVFTTCVEMKKHIYSSHDTSLCVGLTIKQEPTDMYEENEDDNSNPPYGKVKKYVKKLVQNLPYETGQGEETVTKIKTEPLDEDEMTEEMVKEGVVSYNEHTRQRMSQSNMPRRYVCETCQKCFATKSDLRTHIRTHTGETPYKCDYCDRAFKQRGHRKLHIQVTHTKDMPYKCDICGQSYPTRYRYQIHVKRHSGIKEHQCQYCDKAYYTVGKLNEHKRKHHKDQFTQEHTDKETA